MTDSCPLQGDLSPFQVGLDAHTATVVVSEIRFMKRHGKIVPLTYFDGQDFIKATCGIHAVKLLFMVTRDPDVSLLVQRNATGNITAVVPNADQDETGVPGLRVSVDGAEAVFHPQDLLQYFLSKVQETAVASHRKVVLCSVSRPANLPQRSLQIMRAAVANSFGLSPGTVRLPSETACTTMDIIFAPEGRRNKNFRDDDIAINIDIGGGTHGGEMFVFKKVAANNAMKFEFVKACSNPVRCLHAHKCITRS